MTISRKTKRDACWYLVSLSIAFLYLLSVYHTFLPKWSGAVATVLFLSTGAAMFYKEVDDCYMGLVALAFAAMPAIGHAMSENPEGGRYYELLFRLYALGFAFIALAWLARHVIDWLDTRERSKSSK